MPHTINNYDLYPIIETVNQIIDHIQPIEAPTEEVKGEDYDDWKWQARKEFYSKHPWEKMDMFMFRNLIDKYKPVEQELIPLDDLILENLAKSQIKWWVDWCWVQTAEDMIEKYVTFWKLLLSKYWVQQEECEWITLEEAEEQIKQCTWLDKQAIKHDIDWVNLILKHTFNNATPTPQATSVDVEEVVNKIMDTIYNDFWTCESECKGTKSTIKEHLSSLPIVQKKRTDLDVIAYCNKKCAEHDWLCAENMKSNIIWFLKEQNI